MRFSESHKIVCLNVSLLILLVMAFAHVSAQGRPENPGEKVLISFMMEANGNVVAFFEQCSGLGSENEVIEQKVVDKSGNQVVRKLPGRLTWTDVTCVRTITADLTLWDWRDMVAAGNVNEARTDVTISLLDSTGTALAVWTLSEAWPSGILGESNGSATAGVEQLTLVHEGLVRTN